MKLWPSTTNLPVKVLLIDTHIGYSMTKLNFELLRAWSDFGARKMNFDLKLKESFIYILIKTTVKDNNYLITLRFLTHPKEHVLFQTLTQNKSFHNGSSGHGWSQAHALCHKRVGIVIHRTTHSKHKGEFCLHALNLYKIHFCYCVKRFCFGNMPQNQYFQI